MKVLCLQDMFQMEHMMQHRSFALLVQRSFTVPQLVADHLLHPGQRSLLLKCEDAFTMQISMQDSQFSLEPKRRRGDEIPAGRDKLNDA
ncbi:hypothetical protein TNCV_4845091 [Trichonephila clavipes]|uniref:Uncharacterized protein n=1 Tax=Trichonephila clavipes TaxID=2585209 RepID=A0A8X7BMU8_TRICX|nr:hypothetical protein TNCV_4845091 [Trichonephila clavipes]